MARKNPKEYTTIELKKKDFKKLSEYKIHKNQPMWEIISKLIKGELNSDDSKSDDVSN
jgi:hypothetical protein